MLFWIIQTTFLSIIFIFLVHYLIEFFKSTLTVPKIKDLVNSPTQKYQNMFNVIQSNTTQSNTMQSNNEQYKGFDLLPPPQNDMKNELKSFLKKQMNVVESSTDISSLGSLF
jgi:hypothetical protein